MKSKIIICGIMSITLLTITSCMTPVFDSERESSLNYYNTYWDDFSGSLEKGKTYRYENKGFDKSLRFVALQILDDNKVLFIRHREHGELYGSYQDICEQAIILVISSKMYADGVTLQDGNYKCTGTYTYQTKNENSKTVYVLVEEPPAK